MSKGISHILSFFPSCFKSFLGDKFRYSLAHLVSSGRGTMHPLEPTLMGPALKVFLDLLLLVLEIDYGVHGTRGQQTPLAFISEPWSSEDAQT